MSKISGITLITTLKPMKGIFANLQENAIKSWLAIKPQPEIIILGKSMGVSSLARKYHLHYISDLRTTKSGVPYVNDIFLLGQKLATNKIICYINADMVISSDFITTIAKASDQLNDYLLIGRRIDTDISDGKQTTSSIMKLANATGKLHGYDGIDYFVFPKGFWSEMPDLAMARSRWDNWLVYNALSRGKNVVDCTSGIHAIHQNHDYSNIPGGLEGNTFKKEASVNENIVANRFASIIDANYYYKVEKCIKIPPIVRAIKRRLWDRYKYYSYKWNEEWKNKLFR